MRHDSHAPQVTRVQVTRGVDASAAGEEVRATSFQEPQLRVRARGPATTRKAGGARGEEGGASPITLAPPTASSIKLGAHKPSYILAGAQIFQYVVQVVYGSGLLGYPRGE